MAASKIVVTDGTAPAAPGAGKTELYAVSGVPHFRAGASGADIALVGGLASYGSTPSDPGSTASTTFVMAGIAGSITPTVTGTVLIFISGLITNSTGSTSDGAKCQISYGTGTAPANVAALTGTQVGNIVTYTEFAAVASVNVPFSCIARVSGLTVGTAYWLDLCFAAVAGGTALLKNLSVVAQEV